jgi:hypothetical protein
VLDREIGRAWRGRSVASITKPDIHHVLDTIMARGSSVIASHTLAHLKTMFNWAKSRGNIMQSPADKGHRYVKMARCSALRKASLNKTRHTLTQIKGIGLRHGESPPQGVNYEPSPMGSLPIQAENPML